MEGPRGLGAFASSPPLPAADPAPSLPYFVRRSRMHNIPVYRDITHGNRQMTVIRKVEGDIWVSGRVARGDSDPLGAEGVRACKRVGSPDPARCVIISPQALQKDVEDFLSPLLGKTPVTQVNEVTGTLRVKGYFDQQLKAWLLEKGF